MAASDDLRPFDVRTVRRYLTSGRLSREQVDAFVEQLPDCSANVLDPQEGGDDDGFDAWARRRAMPRGEARSEPARVTLRAPEEPRSVAAGPGQLPPVVFPPVQTPPPDQDPYLAHGAHNPALTERPYAGDDDGDDDDGPA